MLMISHFEPFSLHHVSRRIMGQGCGRVSDVPRSEYSVCSVCSFSILYTSGLLMVVGGPAFVEWIRPTDEELRKRYNPDLRQRAEAQGDRRAQEFDDYVNKLKEWSKSDKSSMSRSPITPA